MAHSSALRFKPEFDSFLSATIGESSNGMLLSVVSALTRLNIDPWREAAVLRDMPSETATRRLASLIAELPVEQSGKLDERTVAARLIALLPSQRTEGAPTADRKTHDVHGNQLNMMFAVLTISILVSLSLIIGSKQPSKINHAPTHATAGSHSR
jgi:hypothetical protein